MERGSWADHGTKGYFIGPAPRHYRNFMSWIPTTNATRISNTVEFFPAQNKVTKIDRLDRMGIIIQQLLHLLQEPTYNTTFPIPTEELITTIQELRDLYGIPLTPLVPNTTSKGAKAPPSPPSKQTNTTLYQDPTRPKTRSAHIYHNGTIVRKRFSDGIFEGEVLQYDSQAKFYKIRYTDGDIEELTYNTISHSKHTVIDLQGWSLRHEQPPYSSRGDHHHHQARTT